jgi:hypothetical protein
MNYKEDKNKLISILQESIFKDDEIIKKLIIKLEYKKSQKAFDNFINKTKKDSLKSLSLVNAFIYTVFNKF